MLLELFESAFIALIVSLFLIAFVVFYGLWRKWRLLKFLVGVVLAVFLSPVIFLAALEGYVHDKYNYHMVARTASEVDLALTHKGRAPLIIPGSTNIELWHTMPRWAVKCHASQENWLNALGVWSEKFQVQQVVNFQLDKDQFVYYRNYLTSDEVNWDEKYETPRQENGAQMEIYRNSMNGNVFMINNRW